ncbi:hypothetical protein J5N97_002358 [Dioscorea zingiberensis]|uniref:non-specific serine/threonine protein kinase n=1 Tax=Dioscorea zingiberensis TaxID=325984 RepID=A0A9D5HQB5_9LILI|nr:hypothetical protein J5N97_002358 [Dioscorea zingiberensis]
MKCFYFPGPERDDGGSRVPRIPWSRSLSMASGGGESRRSDTEPAMDWRREDGLRAFGFAELKSATRGFSRSLIIGEGGFGCVYRGVVNVPQQGDDGAKTMDVAVKQLNRNGQQGHKEWITEVNFLGIVKHPNLVNLVGYCAEDDERGIQRLLVYELMANRSLEDHLLGRISSKLSWPIRLKIALDAAHGLAFLHEEMDFQLIFRDFKTSNILLDEHFNAKLSDFGLARHGPAEGIGHISTSVVGTVGYAAPEYVQTGRLTAKSDVWSFGVVLYELITGRRSLDRNLPRSEQKLLDWVKPYATDPKKLHLVIDPRLEGQYCTKSARKLVALANKCLMKQPKSRPRMSEVVVMLEHIIEMPNGKTIPAVINGSPSATQDDTESTVNAKERSSFRSRVFELREIIRLRKVDWPVMKLARTL